jgi:hypothetical protein
MPNTNISKACKILLNSKHIRAGKQKRELCLAGMGLNIISYFKKYPEVISDIIDHIEIRIRRWWLELYCS